MKARTVTLTGGLVLGLTLSLLGGARAQWTSPLLEPRLVIMVINRIDCGQVLAAQPITCTVDVANVGTAPSPSAMVTLEAAGTGQSIRAAASLAPVAAGGQGRASTRLIFPQVGSYTVTASVLNATLSTSVTAVQISGGPGGAPPSSWGVDFAGRSRGPGVFTFDLALRTFVVPMCGGNTGALAQVVVLPASEGTLFPGPSEAVWSWDGQVVKRTPLSVRTPSVQPPVGVSAPGGPSMVVMGSGGLLNPTASATAPPGSSPFPYVTDTLYDLDIPGPLFTHRTHEITVEVRPLPPLYQGQSYQQTATNPSTATVPIDLCDFTVSVSFDRPTYFAEIPAETAIATVQVTNNGPGTCCVRESVAVELSHGRDVLRHPQRIAPRRPGMPTTLTFSLPISMHHPNVRGILNESWTARVNPDGRVHELDEANNTATAQYEVMHRVEDRLLFGRECDTRWGFGLYRAVAGSGDHHVWFEAVTLQNRWLVLRHEFDAPCARSGLRVDGDGVHYDTGIGAYVTAPPQPGTDNPLIIIRVWTVAGGHDDLGYTGAVVIHGPRGLPCTAFQGDRRPPCAQ